LIRLAVRCRPELAERVLAELVELAPDGVEEERGETYVEYAIYGPPGELPAMPDIEAAAGEGLVEVSSTEIPDDWADRWRDFHEPISVGGRLLVQPSWLPIDDGAPETVVVIDPGQAFGTGSHATTRMCLELLLELADAGVADGPLADLGTGSGVLAIAAAKLGWSPVIGYDHERPAIAAAAANAESNGVAVEFRRLNLRDGLPELAPTVVANLTRPLLLDFAGRLGEAGLPKRLVLSGLLRAEIDEVSAAFCRAGLVEEKRVIGGGWAALRLQRVGPTG
jgi:ribosomal protein L11 methyltransferase